MIESIYEYVAKIIIVFFVMTNAGGELGYVLGAGRKKDAMGYRLSGPAHTRFNIDVVLIYLMLATALYVFSDLVEMPGYYVLVTYGIAGAFAIGLVLGFGYFVDRDAHDYKKH